MSVSGRTRVPRTATIPAGSALKNIVVFGESGVGKSSLINLIAGRSIAVTSSSAKGCTFQHKKYEVDVDDTPYAIWDTAGLDEGTYGSVPAEIAEENLRRLLRDLTQADGVHLLVYCVRAARLRKTLLSNYNLFYSAVCRKKVPIVAVVTGLENYEPEMADWWGANESEFATLKMHFDGHACVTTLDVDKVNSPVLKQRCQVSRRAVADLIKNTCSNDRWGTEQEGWVQAALADVRAMIRPAKRDGQPPPDVALYEVPERPVDAMGPVTGKDVPPFEGARLMDVGGSPLRVHRIRDRQLHSGARFRKQVCPRGADLLIFCTSVRADVGISRQHASGFYESYGGDTRPLMIVVRDAVSDEVARAWWNGLDRGQSRQLQGIVRALPSPESPDAHVAIAKLQGTIQTRSLQPFDVAPSGCFGWFTGGRRSAKVYSGTTSFVEEDCLTKSRVWAPWRSR